MRLLEPVHQVEDLGADGDVKSRDRLVGDDEGGAEGEGPGQADALALAAGELVRIAVHRPGAEADLFEQLLDALTPFLAVADAVDGEGLGEDLVDAHARIEGRVGVLEHELHLLADSTKAAVAELGQVVAVEPDLA